MKWVEVISYSTGNLQQNSSFPGLIFLDQTRSLSIDDFSDVYLKT